ncbi:MAG: hypothetical protein P1P64_03290 [Treponemataceae bacterium]
MFKEKKFIIEVSIEENASTKYKTSFTIDSNLVNCKFNCVFIILSIIIGIVLVAGAVLIIMFKNTDRLSTENIILYIIVAILFIITISLCFLFKFLHQKNKLKFIQKNINNVLLNKAFQESKSNINYRDNKNEVISDIYKTFANNITKD